MVRIISTVAFLAGSLSAISSVQALYESFTLDPAVAPTFASPLVGISLSNGDASDAETACDAVADCLGFACRSTGSLCVLFRYTPDGITTATENGYASISYRYDAPSGPSCDSITDEFVNAQGQCECGSELQRQDTNFGCALRSLPSQLPPLRKRNNRIMPGHVKRAAFERVRVRARSDGETILL